MAKDDNRSLGEILYAMSAVESVRQIELREWVNRIILTLVQHKLITIRERDRLRKRMDQFVAQERNLAWSERQGDLSHRIEVLEDILRNKGTGGA